MPGSWVRKALLWVLSILVCGALSSVPANAAFILPNAANQASTATSQIDFSVSTAYLLSVNADHASGDHHESSDSSGAGSSEPVSGFPPAPTHPRLPGEFTLMSGFAFGGSDRGSAGGTSNASGGSSSGAVGLHNSQWRMQGQLLLIWLKASEILVLPTAPPSDIFRPPPIAA